MHPNNSICIFSGTSHLGLSSDVAKFVGLNLGKIQIETFPDGEIGVQINENVRGRDVFVLQTIAHRPNSYLLELLIIIDALKRSSARSITAVIPYFGYARQDRKDKGRVPITAKLVANLLEKSGASRVLTLDLHADQVQGFFDIPLDNLYARPALVSEIEKKGIPNLVVVAPDIGSIKIAKSFSALLNTDLAIIDKRRVNASSVEVNAIIGDVDGKNVLLVDDICSTGGTLKSASWACKKAGANQVFAAVTHGLMIGQAFEESAIEKLFVTDTIPLSSLIQRDRIHVVSIADLFGKAIECIVNDQSISSLFSHIE
ncbi:MAG: ribose-phosphate pyrophosphokinase [Chlamydiae bacterium]|nr:ribose-phosphate pyrophosphokinase [Chlamydiota bacterium]